MHQRRTQTKNAWPSRHPQRDLPAEANAAAHIVHRSAVFRFGNQTNREMVAEFSPTPLSASRSGTPISRNTEAGPIPEAANSFGGRPSNYADRKTIAAETGSMHRASTRFGRIYNA